MSSTARHRLRAAHRIKYFEALYAYMRKRDVAFWTGQQIYDWYSAIVPRSAHL